MPLEERDIEEVARTLHVGLPTTQTIGENAYLQLVGTGEILVRRVPFLFITTTNLLNFSSSDESVVLEHTLKLEGKPKIPKFSLSWTIGQLEDWKLPLSGGIILLSENYQAPDVMSVYLTDGLKSMFIIPAGEIIKMLGARRLSELPSKTP
ncbi:MAG: hypothetical protein ACTSRC_22160 [Candidatus Helarchaeota archaeon]